MTRCTAAAAAARIISDMESAAMHTAIAAATLPAIDTAAAARIAATAARELIAAAIREKLAAAAEKNRFAILFNAFFSVDSPKAIKAAKYDYLNAINYMAPHKSGGFGNVCINASESCREFCLGVESGQAAMVKDNGTNACRESRKRKAGYFFTDNQAYLREMLIHIARLIRKARKIGFKLAVRPNGSSDIPYERIAVDVSPKLAAYLSRAAGITIAAGQYANIFDVYPAVQFVDYTKNPLRFNKPLPANYDLTFSRSESNEFAALALLARGINVAIVFDELPATWNGYQVIDGDIHDLRFLDPKTGVVVGLTQKGYKIRKEFRGFVVRGYRE